MLMVLPRSSCPVFASPGHLILWDSNPCSLAASRTVILFPLDPIQCRRFFENVRAGTIFLGAGLGRNLDDRCSAIAQSPVVPLAFAFSLALMTFRVAALLLGSLSQFISSFSFGFSIVERVHGRISFGHLKSRAPS